MSNLLPSIFGENLMDVFDDCDRNFFRGCPQPERVLYGKNAQRVMKTDIKETETGYELDVDLPGCSKDEIKLELENGYLTISTEKTLEKDQQTKAGRMLRQERYLGTMQRSFYVGTQLTEEDIHATFENGVLHLDLPRKDAKKVPEKKSIRIEG